MSLNVISYFLEFSERVDLVSTLYLCTVHLAVLIK